MKDLFTPSPEHMFSFGLWTVGNRGSDPFGEPTRDLRTPLDLIHLLADTGAYGINIHDNDLVPFDATSSERNSIVRNFSRALARSGLKVPMATTNLFKHPIFKDGAFTSNDPRIRAFSLQKTMQSMDLGAELGAKIYVFWGGREGVETDAAKNQVEALKWYREAINYLCEYSIKQNYGFRFALEAKPNEPRGDLFLPTTGAMLGFIATLANPDMVGVNPEMAHEHMAGLNFVHAVAQAWDAGKLFHIDLNDQAFGRYDQDLRFGSISYKQSFFLVKFLEESGYRGPRHFDAHAYRTEDYSGVKDFVRGCMRSYLILKEKARQFNEDQEILSLLATLRGHEYEVGQFLGKYSPEKAAALKNHTFDIKSLTDQGFMYEYLDQLVFDLLMGIR